jgi:hypothetical protein
MLNLMHDPQRRGKRSQPMRRIEDELDLAESQRELWRTFEDIFEEIRQAIEATEAISMLTSRDHRPSLDEALDAQARRLAVRLGATRRLQTAALVLLAGLTPRQRAYAERHLAVICCGPDGAIAPVA